MVNAKGYVPNQRFKSFPKIDNDFSVLTGTKIFPKKENCKIRRRSEAGIDSKSPRKLRYFFTQASTIYLKNKRTGNVYIIKPIYDLRGYKKYEIFLNYEKWL